MTTQQEAIKLAREALDNAKQELMFLSSIRVDSSTISRAIRKAKSALAALDEIIEPHPPTRHCMCDDCKPSFEDDVVEEPCNHHIVDIRNERVTSGYMCLDCGALFAAADHDAVKEPEPVAYGFPNSAITGSNKWMMLSEEVPENDQYNGALWIPLYTAPPSEVK